MSQRVIERIRKQHNDGDRQQKNLNRRSKLFYVTCDYIQVNSNEDDHNGSLSSDGNHDIDIENDGHLESFGNQTDQSKGEQIQGQKNRTGLVINVQSEPVDLYHHQDGTKNSAESSSSSTSETLTIRERKKLNRKSKLFYVSCDEINVNSFLYDGYDTDFSDTVSFFRHSLVYSPLLETGFLSKTFSFPAYTRNAAIPWRWVKVQIKKTALDFDNRNTFLIYLNLD